MNYFKRVYLRFKIRQELKRLNNHLDVLAKKVRENPNLGNEEVNEENKLFTIDVMTKVIMYKTQLGENALAEKKFLNDLQAK